MALKLQSAVWVSHNAHQQKCWFCLFLVLMIRDAGQRRTHHYIAGHVLFAYFPTALLHKQ